LLIIIFVVLIAWETKQDEIKKEIISFWSWPRKINNIILSNARVMRLNDILNGGAEGVLRFVCIKVQLKYIVIMKIYRFVCLNNVLISSFVINYNISGLHWIAMHCIPNKMYMYVEEEKKWHGDNSYHIKLQCIYYNIHARAV
jgi:hypothetical protein